MSSALTALRAISEFALWIAMAIFALGAVCGAGTILIVAGIFDSWDRAKERN